GSLRHRRLEPARPADVVPTHEQVHVRADLVPLGEAPVVYRRILVAQLFERAPYCVRVRPQLDRAATPRQLAELRGKDDRQSHDVSEVTLMPVPPPSRTARGEALR